jgi:hypothetical protein
MLAGVAGYSRRSLAAKLGVKDGVTVALVGAPAGAEALLPGVRTTRRLPKETELAVVFVTRRADLERRWPALTATSSDKGAVWVAWPKRASGVPTDMTEHVVRDVVLPTGWVDTKVCAIDETWSGLKCVLRVELRTGG